LLCWSKRLTPFGNLAGPGEGHSAGGSGGDVAGGAVARQRLLGRRKAAPAVAAGLARVPGPPPGAAAEEHSNWDSITRYPAVRICGRLGAFQKDRMPCRFSRPACIGSLTGRPPRMPAVWAELCALLLQATGGDRQMLDMLVDATSAPAAFDRWRWKAAVHAETTAIIEAEVRGRHSPLRTYASSNM